MRGNINLKKVNMHRTKSKYAITAIIQGQRQRRAAQKIIFF